MPRKTHTPRFRPFAFMFRLAFQLISWLVLIWVALLLIYAIPQTRPYSILMLSDTLTGKTLRRDWVPLSHMAPELVRAAIASEDGRFCSHRGIDWVEMEKAVDDAVDGSRLRGASTITMQIAKNLFLWHDRSFIRKGLEVPFALAIDVVWSKQRQMEVYLNIAEWGDGIYGAQAASQHYFGRSAADISAYQAAALIAALPNPKARNPARPSEFLAEQAATIEARAWKAGGLDDCVYAK